MRDMTKGAPLGHLFLYALPLLLGNWLQLAYNAVLPKASPLGAAPAGACRSATAGGGS